MNQGAHPSQGAIGRVETLLLPGDGELPAFAILDANAVQVEFLDDEDEDEINTLKVSF